MSRIIFGFLGQTGIVAGTAILMAASAAAQSAPERDPPQWHQEDATPQARYQTARKEAGAAYEEHKKECRTLPAADRKQCLTEARKLWQEELERAKTLHLQPSS